MAEDAVKDTDIVVEAIIENMDIKHKLFKSLDKAAPSYVEVFKKFLSCLLLYKFKQL